MRSPRTRLGSVGAVLLLGLLAAALPAEEPKKDVDPLAKRRDNLARKWADEHAGIGDFCFGRKLFKEAATQYAQALERWPDQPTARARLGWKKDGASWVEDPKAQVKKTNEVTGDAEAKLLKEYEDRLGKLGKKAAEDHWQLGKALDEAKRRPEAEEAWRLAMAYDGEHAKAREALGFTKENGRWVSPEERAERDKVAQRVKQAGEGKEVPGESEIERALGVKLSKRESEHFLIQAYFDQERTKELIRLAEATWVEFHAVFEETQPVVSHIEVIALQSEAQHALYVDKISAVDAREKESVKKMAGDISLSPPRSEGWEGDRGHEYPRDFTVHDTAHVLFLTYMGNWTAHPKGWLYEGTAYWFSAKIAGSAMSYCIGGETGALGAGRDFANPATWRGTVKESIRKGGSPDMRTTLMIGLNSLSETTVMKAWSVIDFLLAKHKKAFLELLAALRAEKEQDGALKAATGWTYADLEREWRKYVLENY
ncbi:MAG: hypothetical protein HYZ53_06210 [Planctomycetes bacterium]|nr:hypothetical protein [Planctomycetota bacterium]